VLSQLGEPGRKHRIWWNVIANATLFGYPPLTKPGSSFNLLLAYPATDSALRLTDPFQDNWRYSVMKLYVNNKFNILYNI